MTKAQIVDIFATGYQKDGLPVSGGTVECYAAGTTTPKAVWTDRDKTQPPAGGVTSFTLDTQGRCVVYGDGLYKFIVKDSAALTVATVDGVQVVATDDFLTTATAKLYSGYVNATATDNALPSGWAASKPSTGNYRVTHNLGFSDPQKQGIVVVSILSGVVSSAILQASANYFDVLTFDGSNVVSDRIFHFMLRDIR